ncbi:MAG: hypothetical protein Q9215_008110, partial [Flavoplaca cf. flavocitrina]
MSQRLVRPAPRSFQKALATRQSYRCLSCSIRLSQSHSSAEFQNGSPQPTTHFGFQEIPSSSKSSRVSSVFSSVASSYDRMNDLMSLGIHRLWKDHFVRSLNPGSKALPPSPSHDTKESRTEPWTMLDIAGGTGDIAFRLLSHATLINNDHSSRVIVSDINPAMLSAGRARSQQLEYEPYTPRLSWLEANAESLPPSIEDNSIDLYTVAFGIRNFTSPSSALREAYRVLKPGGVFACLEFSKVENRVLNAVYK